MIGSKLGPYEITAKLGEGGMGEVYRATDTKLERQVAIKVLPAAFVEDHERLQRFEREAKLLAQLNHPNIAQIYGMEASGEAHALVMELVEGPTLAERLESGPIPLNESLLLARQIAEALEEAHEKGIIHRDLKPQNIKASVEGRVKVLDFGLAKAMDPTGAASGAASASQLAASPTLTLGATMQGMILGTAAYMSPEQAKGFAVDRRADIWAFGVVLFEMLTGNRLFEGDSVPETLAGVLKNEIDLQTLPADVPAAIRRLLRRCLERNPKSRLHDIADARIELDDVAAGRGAEKVHSEVALTSRPGRIRTWLPWVVAAAGVALTWWVTRPAPSPAPPVHRSTIELPAGFELTPRDRAVALSPDGTRLVLVLRGESQRDRLYLRSLEDLEMNDLQGTDGASYPFWAPDGSALGFFADDELRRFDLPNGPVRTLAPALSGRGASWGADGAITFSAASDEQRQGTRLYRVSANGSSTVEPIGPEPESGWSRLPEVLPDGGILYDFHSRETTSKESHLRFLGASSGEVVSGWGELRGEVRYADPGFLAFYRGDLVMVQPFDLRNRALMGGARVVAERVSIDAFRATGHFAFASSALVYLREAPEPKRQLTWFDREGRSLGTVGSAMPALAVSPSPDGTRALVTQPRRDGTRQLWMVELGSGLGSPFTQSDEGGVRPFWAPEGRRIAYWGSGRGSRGQVVIRRTDGTQTPPISPGASAMRGNQVMAPTGWSPDGSSVVVMWYRGVKGNDVAVVAADADAEPRVILDTPAQEFGGTISPDGRWLAYLSDAAGREEAYVTPYPEPGRGWPLTGSGASDLQWTGANELLYADPESRLHIVSFRVGSTGLEIVSRQAVFGGAPLPGPGAYVPALGRFLVAVPIPGQDLRDSLVLVTNWQSEFAR